MKAVGRMLLFGAVTLVFLPGLVEVAEAQKPIRVGASFSKTGTYAELGQTVHRGQSLCIKHVNGRGGVLGRRLELLAEDDQSQTERAVGIYERLITQEKVDAVFSPYSSPITEAVSAVTEKHRMPMVACCAATTSIFKKGKMFIFMLLSPAEVYLEGLVEMASKRGLKTIAVLHEDTLFPRAIAQGTVDLAKKRGLQAVVVEAYPRATKDFSAILGKIKAASPDVVAAATYFDDSVAITRQMKELTVNPKMHAVTVGGDLPKFYESSLGRPPSSSTEPLSGSPSW